VAQEPTNALEFRFEELTTLAPRLGLKVELLPVLALLGAEASFSPAAGTYGVLFGEHMIQIAPDFRHVLVDGILYEIGEAPVVSPGGVAASIDFLDRAVLSPLGYHLQPEPPGAYRIVPGARFADPVTVRPAAADFGATTTLVLTFGRPVTAEVETGPIGPLVHFADASPQLDGSVPLRSRRVRSLTGRGQDLEIEVADGVGVLSSHVLDDPPRVILELGPVRPTPTPAPRRVVENRGPAPIVIDPGHGGDDIGARSNGLTEKDLVLRVAIQLGRILEASGHPVRLTRTGDETRALSDRTALANRLEAKVFISLHANASTVTSVRGAETYYMSLDNATDEAAAATADLENRSAARPQQRSSLDLILWDLAQAEVLNESAGLALDVQTRLNSRLGLRDRGVKQAPFVVLTGATMPAILVELGFLSNEAEAKQLADPAHQLRLAEAIALGVRDFLRGS